MSARVHASVCLHLIACAPKCVLPSVLKRCLWDNQGWREMDQKQNGQAVTEEELGCVRKRDRMGLKGGTEGGRLWTTVGEGESRKQGDMALQSLAGARVWDGDAWGKVTGSWGLPHSCPSC